MNTRKANTIYCDEAGFTGNDLFALEQPHFVYSSVLVDPLEAAEVVGKTIKDFRLQSSELKGKTLLNSRRGQSAATWVLENYNKNALVIVFEKRYSLAGKFFEYIFEPVLASHSSIFYKIRFHRFISNILYLHLLTQQSFSEQLLLDFQTSIRARDIDRLENILAIAASSPDMAQFLCEILTFAACHRDKISEELKVLREDGATGSWVLELSLTALYNLLAKWGEQINGMEVYCDDSKPIVTQGDFLDVMINREDRQYIQVGNKAYPITFNLSQPIQTVSSKDFPGIQIADVFASSIAYTLKENDEFSQHCREVCNDIIHPNSVFPQLEYADLEKPQGYINALVLTELINRTLRGQSLFDGIEDFVESAMVLFPEWCQQYRSKSLGEGR